MFQTNWRTGRRFLKMEFHTQGASAYVDADGAGRVWIDNAAEPTVDTTFTAVSASDVVHIVQGFEAESRAFVDAVRSGRELHNNLADAVKTMQLADLIYESSMNDWAMNA